MITRRASATRGDVFCEEKKEGMNLLVCTDTFIAPSLYDKLIDRGEVKKKDCAMETP